MLFLLTNSFWGRSTFMKVYEEIRKRMNEAHNILCSIFDGRNFRDAQEIP
jgi:hypothetical protein